MLASSAVTQFPTNGSTRVAGETVQASVSAEHVMIVEKRKIRIASPELGTARTFLARLARECSRLPMLAAPLQRPDAEPG
jgi:hypothetical protein